MLSTVRRSDNENKQVMVNLMQSMLEDPILQAGNPVKEFLPKLNLPDHETEVCGIDILHLYEVFSLEVKRSSIRILLALVAQIDLELVQMDVKTAFLHGDLEEEIYMVQPEGFKVAGKEHEHVVMNLTCLGLAAATSGIPEGLGRIQKNLIDRVSQLH
ncbi:retrovirus-related pol polyprotein from transposon TNT 1-94 [Tanacetum coccineum]